MMKIGITGGIGSGKSVVCRIFESFDIPVYTADKEASRIMISNNHVKQALVEKFGDDIYTIDGELNRIKIASIIFNDKTSIAFINSIVHPVVAEQFLEWSRNQISKYCIMEAAILFESGVDKIVNKSITVYAPESIRIRRVMQRDNVHEEAVLKRIKNQMSDEEKVKRSDFVIYNDDTQMLVPQVIKLHNLFSE